MYVYMCTGERTVLIIIITKEMTGTYTGKGLKK